MKKLILAVAIVASGFSTFALSNTTIQNHETTVSITEEFNEIAVENVPTAVTEALTKEFAMATLDKAFVNSKEQYKLEVTIDGTKNTLYLDKDGNWLKEADTQTTEE